MDRSSSSSAVSGEVWAMEHPPPDLCGLCDVRVPEPNGVVTIRHRKPGDADALRSLYSRMSEDDIRMRFFTASTPPEQFFDDWSRVSESGAFGLLAVQESEPGDTTVVGEAGWGAVSEGEAELGIAVDPDHRGWLGALLLDSLLRHARERGLLNLHAVVLTDNKAMLGLARRRGFAIVEHPQWGMMRLSLGTGAVMPSWPLRRRGPRVLIESRWVRGAAEEALREAGYEVALCPGPCLGLDHCPVLTGEPCSLVEGADAVVVDIPTDDPLADLLMKADPVVHPSVPVLSGHRTRSDGTSERVPDRELLAALEHLRRVARHRSSG
jgi:RimJ/RimL family protein N-acetyltransferase